MYWPRSLRRPSDIWSRLPRAARWFRITASGFLLVLPATILARAWFSARAGSGIVASLVVVEIVTVLAGLTALLLAWRWTRLRKLSVTESLRLMLGPTTSSSGWHTHRLQQTLLAPGSGVRGPDPDDPADYARAIKQLAGILPSNLVNVRLTAVDAAEHAAEYLTRDAQHMLSMRADVEPADVGRINGRLAALGTALPGETGERAEMRTLLEHELELVQTMRQRLELASSVHLERFALLKSLYEALCEPFVRPGEQNGSTLAARILTICSDLRTVTTVTLH
jgi:hypothetical protein